MLPHLFIPRPFDPLRAGRSARSTSPSSTPPYVWRQWDAPSTSSPVRTCVPNTGTTPKRTSYRATPPSASAPELVGNLVWIRATLAKTHRNGASLELKFSNTNITRSQSHTFTFYIYIIIFMISLLYHFYECIKWKMFLHYLYYILKI